MENKTAEEMNRVWKDWSMGIITLKEAVDQEFDFRTKIIKQQLAEKDKEIERLKKSLEGLLDGVDTFCKTIPAQMTSEAIYLWEKRTEAHESLNK